MRSLNYIQRKYKTDQIIYHWEWEYGFLPTHSILLKNENWKESVNLDFKYSLDDFKKLEEFKILSIEKTTNIEGRSETKTWIKLITAHNTK